MAQKTHDVVSSAEEAAKILLQLSQTKQLRSIRFEFSMDMDCVPVVNYAVERLAFRESAEAT